MILAISLLLVLLSEETAKPTNVLDQQDGMLGWNF